MLDRMKFPAKKNTPITAMYSPQMDTIKVYYYANIENKVAPYVAWYVELPLEHSSECQTLTIPQGYRQ